MKISSFIRCTILAAAAAALAACSGPSSSQPRADSAPTTIMGLVQPSGATQAQALITVVNDTSNDDIQVISWGTCEDFEELTPRNYTLGPGGEQTMTGSLSGCLLDRGQGYVVEAGFALGASTTCDVLVRHHDNLVRQGDDTDCVVNGKVLTWRPK